MRSMRDVIEIRVPNKKSFKFGSVQHVDLYSGVVFVFFQKRVQVRVKMGLGLGRVLGFGFGIGNIIGGAVEHTFI